MLSFQDVSEYLLLADGLATSAEGWQDRMDLPRPKEISHHFSSMFCPSPLHFHKSLSARQGGWGREESY